MPLAVFITVIILMTLQFDFQSLQLHKVPNVIAIPKIIFKILIISNNFIILHCYQKVCR